VPAGSEATSTHTLASPADRATAKPISLSEASVHSIATPGITPAGDSKKPVGTAESDLRRRNVTECGVSALPATSCEWKRRVWRPATVVEYDAPETSGPPSTEYAVEATPETASVAVRPTVTDAPNTSAPSAMSATV
jgi:hypothetical protein